MDIPEARRLERPAWLNGRTVLGLVIFALAFLGAQRAIEAQRTTTPLWVATRDLATGQMLMPSDLSVVEAVLPGDQSTGYALASTDLAGSIVGRPVGAGELVPLSAVSTGDAAGPGRAMTVPVEAEHAVGGEVGPGDLVDVYATFEEQGSKARTILLLRSTEVLSVMRAGGLVQEEASVGLTLSVSPEDAGRLAFAVRTATIDVVRVDNPSVAANSTTITSEELP
jgi:Flp pilus assembly protein CpaB